ncbi:DUF2782 domain-containing protein [Halomonas sp. NO4]|uniref:DUF2782 domain-containing protein n=1 Tax=Halomonas sp. NO4 TaxID=2484813 RepID=UPI0013D1ABE1|nr:DUF2782 domain-containing protein [Halomonas sp. NO4]
MNTPRRWPAILCLALGFAFAAPAHAQSGSQAEPEITVRQEAQRTLREYRVNGELYAIEIRPADGADYYLVDRDGDGNFDRQENAPQTVPDWVQRR